MRLVEIDNIKNFTSALFARDTFDNFLITEASFSTLTNITIDGHINQEYMGEAELALPENKESKVRWGKIRPLAYEIIKGQKVPLRFKIVFMMPSDIVLSFLDKAGLNFEPVQVNALFLNIVFQDGKLTCTTGTSMKAFSMDKSLEVAWDEYMIEFIKSVQK